MTGIYLIALLFWPRLNLNLLHTTFVTVFSVQWTWEKQNKDYNKLQIVVRFYKLKVFLITVEVIKNSNV